MSDRYILDGKAVIECNDIIQWARWYESADRKVAKTKIGKVHVSTIFLGLNHGYLGGLELFETMIFGGELDQECWRYATWDEAEKGHAVAVEKVLVS